MTEAKKKRKLKVTERRGEDTLSSNKPYELEEIINDITSTLPKGL